jgi:hypothetical protein
MGLFKRKPIQLFEEPVESTSLEKKSEQNPIKKESPSQTENKPEKETEKTLSLGLYYSENKDEVQVAKIAEADRATHLYVIGATGTGKTKFLEYLIKQDIEKGNGFGVIDPHGDLIEDIKGFLIFNYGPDDSEITDKVVLIDPVDPDYTVTFNPLEKIPGVPVAEQANELISAFRKIWADSWGVRMEDLLRNSLIALGEAELTLTDLPRFLTNRSFRQGILEKVKNPLVQDYFQRFDSLTDRGQIAWIEPVTNKLSAFFADERIGLIFSSERSSFNLREIMDSKRILLIKLDKGKLKDSADLLGSLLMAKIQMAAFSRSDVPQKKRTPFYLYIDEFQNFASESFAVVLSEARKYGLSLIMAHQTLAQIPEELRSLILGNTGIQVYFRLNRHDASILAKEGFEYSGFELKAISGFRPKFWSLSEEWEQHVRDLQSLEPRICYVKHKVEGGIIEIMTENIETAQEVFVEILGQSEEQFDAWFKTIPFGRRYLVERDKLKMFNVMKQLAVKEKVEPPKRPIEEKPEERARGAIPHEERRVEVPIIREKPKTDIRSPKEKEVSQHRYLQNLVKKIAEEKGYKATIESPVLDGSGRVDVSLERNGRRIACEISMTSPVDQELKNIEKCLVAGYEKVLVCSPDKRTLENIRGLITENIPETGQKKIYFFQPEELLFFLEGEAAAELSKEERIKGYKVKVRYQVAELEETRAKREAVAHVILMALKRMKEKK